VRPRAKLADVIADVGCDPSTNYLIMRGVQRDLDRAREMISALDVPTQQITKLATQVTKIIRLNYIDLSSGDFSSELNSVITNPYFGGLVQGINGNPTTVNSISLDKNSNSIIFVGEEKYMNVFIIWYRGSTLRTGRRS